MPRYPFDDTLDETATQVSDGPCDIKFLQLYNNDSTKYFLQVFDALSSTVTVGTTTPLFHLVIPADNGNTVTLDVGYRFKVACTVAVTTTRSGSTGPTTDVDAVAFYG